ncbi:MAG: glycoside hydrolase family 127 protein [Chloroflexi bacterium]|nr:glycoside hydrolase family 127 protein [Chloroflexota bacterium]
MINKLFKKLPVTLVLCCINTAVVFSQYVGQFSSVQTVKPQIQVKAYSFDLSDIKLLDSRFKENMERDGKWLLSINNRRLLHSWQVNAGMSTNARSFGGWEGLDVELRGHSLGHVLSGLALMYASTGEIAYKSKADSLVRALAEIQQVINQGGYLSAFPQNLVNRAIEGKPVWAPWYTLHKVMEGLIDMYQYAGNKQALDVVIKMSGWAYHKLENLSPEQLAIMHKTEFGGMMEAAYNLYAITGNVNDKKLAEFFYHHSILDPLAGKEDKLAGNHANTQIPKIIGEARGYELTGNEKERNIADFFWQTVIDHHTYVTGGNSDREFFFEPDQISKHISSATTESCNTYNMLKLTRHLFTWTANAKYADYYEQALYNHILASQDPQTGMVMYFLSYTPGTFKTYCTKDSSFWCCVGTGFENHAKYGEGVYYHDDKGIYVNLFIPSELTWKEKGIKLVQQTGYPEEATTHLTIQEIKEGNVPLYIRYPSWATSGATVKINGKNVKISEKPGSYIVLNKIWKTGDKIDITYPMSLRLVATNDNPNMAAVVYGPIVLAGDMSTEGIEAPATYAKNQLDNRNTAVPDNIVTTLNINGRKLNDWLINVNGKQLVFKTTGVASKEITMIPYYQINKQRYVIYWNLK